MSLFFVVVGVVIAVAEGSRGLNVGIGLSTLSIPFFLTAAIIGAIERGAIQEDG